MIEHDSRLCLRVEEGEESAGALGRHMTRPLILVVEDDLGVRGPLEKFLTLRGFDVISADTAEAAQQRLRESRITGAVIDLRLRQGSGARSSFPFRRRRRS